MRIPEERQDSFFEDLAHSLQQAALEESQETTDEAYDLARELSSGTLTTAQQRALDNPFAKRHGAPLLPPFLVSKHSGEFYAGWKKTDAQIDEATGDITGASVFNDSRIAPFLEQPQGGSEKGKMFARPVSQEVADVVVPEREKRLEEALKRNQPR